VSANKLKTQVVDGLKWSVLAKVLTQVFSWVSTFMVIRVLTPEDYGLVGISMVFFSFIAMFTTNGLTSALIQTQGRERRPANQIFTLSLLLNVTLSGLIALSAPWFAEMYNNEALVPILWLLALMNPLTSLIVVPSAHLSMEMRFKEKAIAESVAGLIAATVAFGFAMNGAGFWSLIYANIALTISRVIGYNYYSRSKYRLTLKREGAATLFTFAMNIQIGTFVWFLYNNTDTMIVGKFLGVEKLGFYSVASEVASIPMSKVSAILNDVGFSAFSTLKDNPEEASRYVEKAILLIGLIAFPVFLGISAIANEFVLVLLGEKWASAGLVIMVLCWVFPLRMVNSVLTNFANGMGETKFCLHNALITAVILISAITVGAMQGLFETALAWVFGFVGVFSLVMWRFSRKFNLSFKTLTIYWLPALLSISMWFVLMGLEYFVLPTGLEPWMLMVIKIAAGALWVLPWYYKCYLGEFKQLLNRG
jgi:teichuronic acid exporter